MLLLKIVHTLITRILVLFIILICAVPLLLLLLVPERWRYNKLLFLVAHFFYWASLQASLIPIHFKGEKNVPFEPSVIVANHQSSLDIPMVGFLMHRHPHIWLATNYLLKSPLFWYWLQRVAVIVDMTTPMTGMRSLIKTIELLKNNNRHVIIFPEGQRYDDGQIHDFFAGFVLLARKTNRPVVPIRIFNANKVYPRGAFLANWYPITVVVGKPMNFLENESDEEFKNRVHQWFLEQSINS